jgi:hypothetical protein
MRDVDDVVGRQRHGRHAVGARAGGDRAIPLKAPPGVHTGATEEGRSMTKGSHTSAGTSGPPSHTGNACGPPSAILSMNIQLGLMSPNSLTVDCQPKFQDS